MGFAKIAWYCAVMMVILSVTQIVIGLVGAIGTDSAASSEAFARRYLGARTTGQAVSSGIYGLLFGAALGVIANIADTLSDILEALTSKEP